MDPKDEYITLSRYCNEVRETQRPINHHYMRAALETSDDVRRFGNYILAPRRTFDAIYAQWEKWSEARRAEIRSWRQEHCKSIASMSRGGSAKVRSDTFDLLLREIIELLKNMKR